MKLRLALLVPVVGVLVQTAPLPAQEAKKDKAKLIAPEAKKAIDDGLTFLAKEQGDDGSWKMRGDKHVGITSLCGLAFLAADNVPGRGPHAKVVEKALQFVLNNEDNRNFGFFNEISPSHGPMYSQALVTLFLAEASMLMPKSKLKESVDAALKRAADFIVKAQNKTGGWRYTPTSKDADVSVTCFQLRSLTAARRAGIAIPKAAIDRATDFVVSCHDPVTGGFRYQAAGGAPNVARTAAAATVLTECGKGKHDATKKAFEFLQAFPQKGIQSPLHYFYGNLFGGLAIWFSDDKVAERFGVLQKDILTNAALRKDSHWDDRATGVHYSTGAALIILQIPRENLTMMRGAD